MNYRDIKQWFSQISLTSVYQLRPKIKLGVQVNYSPHTNRVTTTALLQTTRITKKPERFAMYKVKLDSLLTLCCLARYHHNHKFAFSVGCKIPFYDKSETNKLGVRVDINM